MFSRKKESSEQNQSSVLSEYKLRYEKPRVKRTYISMEAIKEMKRAERKAAKAKAKAEKEPKAIKIDVRTYPNIFTWALPVAISTASVRGTTALVINILFLETVVTIKRVKR